MGNSTTLSSPVNRYPSVNGAFCIQPFPRTYWLSELLSREKQKRDNMATCEVCCAAQFAALGSLLSSKYLFLYLFHFLSFFQSSFNARTTNGPCRINQSTNYPFSKWKNRVKAPESSNHAVQQGPGEARLHKTATGLTATFRREILGGVVLSLWVLLLLCCGDSSVTHSSPSLWNFW